MSGNSTLSSPALTATTPALRILSKGDATKAIAASLFQPGGTLACLPKVRFDRGKYEKSVIDREVPAHMQSRVRLVWAERQRDRDGPYYALFCIQRDTE